MLKKIKKNLAKAYQVLLPTHCTICGLFSINNQTVCKTCRENLPILPKCCIKCAYFLPNAMQPLVCGSCLNAPPPFDYTHVLFPYLSPIAQCIIKLKFQHQLIYAKAMADLFIEQIETWYLNKNRPNCLIPIPLHPTRLQDRGFNQALEIAKPIARHYKMQLDYRGTKRIKPTLTQTRLNASLRQKNMQDAFITTKDWHGINIAVLDDVMTTGATLHAFCKLLKERGASQIHVWCVARRC